ncbi:NAD(P)H pyrophosphatase NUDT13, mitochondrial [Spea bombifrons]|uniref:NAD(P)H pyrophosphatase NUDT13, mitochondrial n=1 Tax=Spea bombifrons TaxID=233779 RepID=UPI00234AEB96|nr:NAD(P)H pyrophosphatase NUDT13, mitochondrial [Spea bombifrons]
MLRGLVNHPVASLCFRLSSSYVRQTRYLFELKENDDICRQARKLGSFYLFHNLSPLVKKSDNRYFVPTISAQDLQITLNKHGQDGQKIEDAVLIGCTDSCIAQFAVDLGLLEKSTLEAALGGKFTYLPKAFMQLSGKDAPLLAQAQALLRWHDTHQFCSKTGKPTVKNVSGSKRVCSTNGMIYYPQMSPVVITLVSYKNRCLLARQESFPAGMYTALSGFCDIGETLEDTIRREVAEEVGLEVESLRYSGSQHWPFPNSSLMVACQATVQHDELNVNRSELEAARWFTLDEVEEALQRDIVHTKNENGTVPIWVPPKWAIAHHLIQEWVKEQKALKHGNSDNAINGPVNRLQYVPT